MSPDEREAPDERERVGVGMGVGRGLRWVCDCSVPPVLLAIYDRSGRIEIKVRDRRYIAHDQLQATCPRCGTRHTLNIRQPPAP